MGRNENGVAATLSRTRTELVTIETVDLPRLYRAIGKRVAALPKVPPSLTSHVENIRRMENANPLGADPTADARRQAAYAILGQAAVDQFGQKAIPKDIAPELTRLKERRQVLAAEIATLEAQPLPGSRGSRRLLAAAVATACLAGAFIAVRISGVLSLGRTNAGDSAQLQRGLGGNSAEPTVTAEGYHKPLPIDREKIRAFEKAVVSTADGIKTEITKSLDALRGKKSVESIQSGYDAVLAQWKERSRMLAAPLEKEPLLKHLSFMADKAVQQEVLGESEETLERELESVTTELSQQVESQKESAEYAFGGLNDLGKRFDRSAEEREKLVTQCCSRLAVAFDNATTRLAGRRLDVLRNAVGMVEAKAKAAEDAIAAERARSAAEEAENTRLLVAQKAAEEDERTASQAQQEAKKRSAERATRVAEEAEAERRLAKQEVEDEAEKKSIPAKDMVQEVEKHERLAQSSVREGDARGQDVTAASQQDRDSREEAWEKLPPDAREEIDVAKNYEILNAGEGSGYTTEARDAAYEKMATGVKRIAARRTAVHDGIIEEGQEMNYQFGGDFGTTVNGKTLDGERFKDTFSEVQETLANGGSRSILGPAARAFVEKYRELKEPEPDPEPEVVAENVEPATWEQWLEFENIGPSKWLVESSSGANDFSQRIGHAINKALGPLDEGFRARSYRGITLGSDYSDLAPDTPEVLVDPDYPFLLAVASNWEQGEDDRFTQRWAIVDAASNKVVGLKVSCLLGPSDTLAGVQRDFGKTRQEIKQITLDRGQYRNHWSTLRYTFPSTIVCVEFLETTGKFTNGATHIWIFDRRYVEKSMRAYANALATCCLWMKKCRAASGKNGFAFGGIPPLAGIKLDVDESHKWGRVFDTKQKELCERASDTKPNWNQPAWLIAAIGTFTDGSVIVCDPGAPAQVRMGKLRGLMAEMGCYTLSETPACDLLQGVASVLMQEYFEPVGTQIRVIREETPRMAYVDIDDDSADQVRSLFNHTLGIRYEWYDKEGWLIRVADTGVVSLDKSLDE